MIFKTYLIEKNIDQINKNFFLFYGENIGLKKELIGIISCLIVQIVLGLEHMNQMS